MSDVLEENGPAPTRGLPVTTPTQAPNLQDDRWGDYVPWFLRYSGSFGRGNFELFFQRLSQRISRLFQYNEAGLPNIPYFGAVLETETLQRYRHNPLIALHVHIEKFFLPQQLKEEAKIRCYGDPEYKEAALLEKRVSLRAGGVALVRDVRPIALEGKHIIVIPRQGLNPFQERRRYRERLRYSPPPILPPVLARSTFSVLNKR